jgi:hypothetical protein
MLVEQAITVEKAGIVGSTFASSNTSRAILLHVRFGSTVPHAAKSGFAPASCAIMACTTGTESSTAS